MTAHINWIDISVEIPTKPGLYLICHPNPTCDEPWVDQAEWYDKGGRIYLDLPPGGTELERIQAVLYDEYTFFTPNAGFWYNNGDKAWELKSITHWAFIPNLPDGYTRSEDIP